MCPSAPFDYLAVSTPQASYGPYSWRVASASVCGSRHQKTGQPCQDAFYWRIMPKRVLVAAVADGAGSAALSEVGAATATWTAATRVGVYQREAGWPATAEGWHTCLTDAFRAAQTAVAAAAVARRVVIRELATTLMVVIATSTLVAVMQVGDGAVVVGDEDGNLVPLTIPQGGEYANETTFLISPDALATAQFRLWSGFPAFLAAFTDGLQRLALTMPGGTPHVPFFLPVFRCLATATQESEAQAQVEALLRSRRLRERTDDDLTLVVATLVR